jgi:hypothetical protein
MVARTERSPGFGTPLAFPVAQWRLEWSAWPEGQAPVTVAGPRRYYTGFRVAPFVLVQLYCSASLRTPPARRKGRLELGLQSCALTLVHLPLLLRRLLLPPQVAGVETRNCGDQRICRTGDLLL